MASRYQNITINQGEDFAMTANVYKDQSEKTTSITIDGSWTIAGQIRKSYYHTNAVLSFITGINSGSDPAKIDLSLTRDNTSAISAGRYVYDIEVTSDAGDTPANTCIRILEGIATVTPGVTR